MARLTVEKAQAEYQSLVSTKWANCAGLPTREAKVLAELETLQREHPHIAQPLDDGLAAVWAQKLADEQSTVERLLERGSGSNPVARLQLRDAEKSVDFWRRKLAARRRQLAELAEELEGS